MIINQHIKQKASGFKIDGIEYILLSVIKVLMSIVLNTTQGLSSSHYHQGN